MLTVRTVAPATEPVTLTEAKAHLRVDISTDDTLITSLIVSAREQAEEFTRRGFITQTWKAVLDRFPVGRAVELKAPLISVSSITYLDADGTEQTLSTDVYQVDTVGGRVFLKYDQVWPTTRVIENAVAITFVCGYGAASAVPQSIKSAILLTVGDLYENREVGASLLSPTSERLLWPYRDLKF